jgi:hypothetical protein
MDASTWHQAGSSRILVQGYENRPTFASATPRWIALDKNIGRAGAMQDNFALDVDETLDCIPLLKKVGTFRRLMELRSSTMTGLLPLRNDRQYFCR